MHLTPQIDPARAGAPHPSGAWSPALDHVVAPLTYLIDNGEKPATYIPESGVGEVRRTGRYAPYPVPIHNGRPLARDLSLDRHGFVLTRHDTGFVDFHDPAAVRGHYYPEMERLVQTATGATRRRTWVGSTSSRTAVRLRGDRKTTARAPSIITVHHVTTWVSHRNDSLPRSCTE